MGKVAYPAFVRPERLRKGVGSRSRPDHGGDRGRGRALLQRLVLRDLSGKGVRVGRAAAGRAPARGAGVRLMFLVHPTLTEDDTRATCRAVEAVLAVAGS